MRTWFLGLSLSLALGLQAQTNNQALALHGFERQVSQLFFLENDSQILGYGMNWMGEGNARRLAYEYIIWDSKEAKVLKKQNFGALSQIQINGQSFRGSLGACALSPDQKQLLIIGTQYAAPGQPNWETVFHFHNLATGQTSSQAAERNFRISQVVFHPNDPDLLGVLAMDNEKFEFQAGLYSLSQGKIIRTFLQGRGALIPLSIDFSRDGQRVYVGYGNSAYNGGWEIYNLADGKRLRQFPLRDQAMNFFEWEGQLIVSGHNSTFSYTLNTWALRRTDRIRLSALHSSGLAALYPIQDADLKRQGLFDFRQARRRDLNREALADIVFSQDGKRLAGARFKAAHLPNEQKLEIPSVWIYNLD